MIALACFVVGLVGGAVFGVGAGEWNIRRQLAELAGKYMDRREGAAWIDSLERAKAKKDADVPVSD